MRIITKLIVVFSGMIVGLSISFLTLFMLLADRLPFVLGMIIVFVLYIVGLFGFLIKTKKRFLFIALAIYTGYFFYEIGVITLYRQPSQYTLTVVLMVVMSIGMALTTKKKRDSL